jgi:predicted DNA-binding transcriptional regulator AlpA
MARNQGFSGKRLLNVEEAAQYLGLAPRTLYNRCAPKAADPFPVKPKRVGKCVRFDIRDLDAYIDSLAVGTQSGASTE